MSEPAPDTYELPGRRWRARSLPRTWPGLSELGALLGTAVLPFALVLYLGLKGGGYDAIVRSEVGIAVWWIVLVGVAAGLLPTRRLPRWGVIGLAALLAFACWTALGIAWSESAERSAAEVARVASLLGVFALALSLQRSGNLRRTIGGVAAAIALLGILALGSRLHPSWFPTNETATFLDAAQSRLNWPLNYWNGLAALLAMGIPLLLALATAARTVIVRAASAAVVPALVLAAFFTLSRGGAVELVIALIAVVALSSSRTASLPTWLIATGASALLVIAANHRAALTDGLTTEAALQQGDEMLALTLIVCAAVTLLVAAMNLGFRGGILPEISVPSRVSRPVVAAAALLALAVFFIAGGPSKLSDGFNEFKDPEQLAGSDVSRFQSVNGSNRWQIWSSAADANAADPLIGIGPGTFEFWWAEEGRSTATEGFVRDAHSLYLETLGELGIIGLVLLAGLVAALLTAVGQRWWRSVGGERKLLAGVLGAMAAFLVAAAIDWAWELTVLPVAFLLLAAAGVAGFKRRTGDRSPSPEPLNVRSRVLVGAVSILAIAAILVPLATTQELRASQDAAAESALSEALGHADSAEALQPFAGSPPLQRAMVLEEDGRYGPAAQAAEAATRAEPTNWRTWFVLARIQGAQGDAEAALQSFKRAKALNPTSPIFNGGG